MRSELLVVVWGILHLSIVASLQAQTDCTEIFPPTHGWVIDQCATDPSVTVPMAVHLDGEAKGDAVVVRFSHVTESGSTTPQVAIFYSSGFVRLKQNADPDPPNTFGSSFVLGPAYWPDEMTYHHNPQLSSFSIDTSDLPGGPIRLHVEGRNNAFSVTYEMALPTPLDRQTRLLVAQTYTADIAVAIDPVRRGEAQGLKLVQFSSMFLDDGAGGGFHDADAVRFIATDGARRQAQLNDVCSVCLFFDDPVPMGSTWLDVLHTDDEGWQGNTPNIRIALDELPSDRTVTPQGFRAFSMDPNTDNIGVWIHDDGQGSASWQAGERATLSYWLLSQDDPPDPWDDLGLRSGVTLLDFEGAYDCRFIRDSNQPGTGGSVNEIAGYEDTSLELTYELVQEKGNYAQLRCDFDPPLDLSAYDHFRFEWRGFPDARNSLEIGVINPGGGGDDVFFRSWERVTHRAWWGQVVVPFRSFVEAGNPFDPSTLKAFFVTVENVHEDDVGGSGRLAFDNLGVFNVHDRTIPDTFEFSPTYAHLAEKAAQWLADQQLDNGLLKSWEEELSCLSHTYDQALALLVFSLSGRWAEADAIVVAFGDLQNTDGSWFQTHLCDTEPLEPALNSDKWEGDISWMIFALSRYLFLGGQHPGAGAIRDGAAEWLKGRISPDDGCLVFDHTEGTIDAWWAMRAAGPQYADYADGLRECLLAHYWDPDTGRFKGGRNNWTPFLDNQTWGAPFLRDVGQAQDGRRALSFAEKVLRVPARGGQLHGFDGQGGPWSVWNEGTLQYSAAGGAGAAEYVHEVLAQQRIDGAVPGSPNDFLGGGVFTTRWHGVAPTSWLYFALHPGEPFQLPCDEGPANPATDQVRDLDDTAADWGVFCEGSPTWRKRNVDTPSLDGSSLECSLTGGDPFSNVHCYRNLLSDSDAVAFRLSTAFYFTPETTCDNQGEPSIVQAIEFTMNKFQDAQRWEWALQWENVGEGAPQWRYWAVDEEGVGDWAPFDPPIEGCLAANQWHNLSLKGEIVGGRTFYRSFTIDGRKHPLSVVTDPVATSAGDLLAVAFQLDGNFQQDPYWVFFDKVDFFHRHEMFEIFSDGFETGDCSRWSNAPPCTIVGLPLGDALQAHMSSHTDGGG